MTLDWPEVTLALGALAATVVGLKTALPYFVGLSSERARQAALEEVNKRLTQVEAHLAANTRTMPGRLR